MNKDKFSQLEIISIFSIVDFHIKYIEKNNLYLDKSLVKIREKLMEEIKEHQS